MFLGVLFKIVGCVRFLRKSCLFQCPPDLISSWRNMRLSDFHAISSSELQKNIGSANPYTFVVAEACLLINTGHDCVARLGIWSPSLSAHSIPCFRSVRSLSACRFHRIYTNSRVSDDFATGIIALHVFFSSWPNHSADITRSRSGKSIYFFRNEISASGIRSGLGEW